MTSTKEILEKLYENRKPEDFYRLIRENAIKRTKFLGKYFLKPNQPNFLIIGAQKSGTTSLHYYLNQHPLLVGTRPKEIHFFDRWINYGYGIDWYEKHFNHLNPKNKLFFEATPNYLYHKSIPPLISAAYPNIKLLVILRDPVKRAFSEWNMYYDKFTRGINYKEKKGRFPNEKNIVQELFFENRNYFPDFKEVINIELDIIKRSENDQPSIIRKGIYINQIKNLFKYFERQQVLILGFNELVKDTKVSLEKIYDFLNIKGIDYQKLKIEPRHSRPYQLKIRESDKEVLTDFYDNYNKELFEYLEYKLNW